jgi:uncharacterized small protein (DUF1192 family)
MAKGKRISIKLTPEQKKQIKAATGKSANELELSIEELEERIAPARVFIK